MTTFTGTDLANDTNASVGIPPALNTGNDTFNGLGGDDVFSGGLGNDIMNGGEGNETLNGNTGTDTASYDSAGAAVTVSLAIAGVQVTGGAGTDTLIGIENLTGSDFGDTLTGNTAANVLDGGDGNDI